MRKLLFMVLPIVALSCSEKTSSEVTKVDSGRKFSLNVVDTVMVDTGDDILYVQGQSAQTAFNADFSNYFNYNGKQNLIDVIDLHKMKVERQIPFETEGPNGTTSYISAIGYYGEGNFMLNNYMSGVQLFDGAANKLDHFRLDNETLEGDSLDGDERIVPFGAITDDGTTYYSYYSIGFGEPRGIAKIDVSSRTFTKIPVEGLDAVKDFKVVFEREGGMTATHAAFYFDIVGQKLLMSNNAINELFVYDLVNGGIEHFSYESQLTDNIRHKPSKNKANSQEEFRSLSREIGGNVNFLHWIPDPEKQLYYRLSVGENGSGTTVLTVLDGSFRQIAEAKVDYSAFSSSFFVRDGRIYSRQNIEDELAFVVAEIEEG